MLDEANASKFQCIELKLSDHFVFRKIEWLAIEVQDSFLNKNKNICFLCCTSFLNFDTFTLSSASQRREYDSEAELK